MMALEDLRFVETVDVYKGDIHAGTLQRIADGSTAFTYRDEYRDDPSLPDLAFTLPRSAPSATAPQGALPPFFAGLLPEGVRLAAVLAGTRTSADDQLTLLLAVGQDAVGDVGVVPAGSDWPPHAEVIDEATIPSRNLEEVFANAVSADPELFERVALPGVQPKVSAMMWSTPLPTMTGPAILKLNPPRDFPHLIDNEAFFLRMAHDCGLPVPTARVVTDQGGARGLLVERFDRVVTEGGVTRLAQEDGCQLLGRYPADKYRVKTENVARAVAEAVELGNGSRPLALLRLVQLVAFSYLVGNGDLHAKNISVSMSRQGIWGLTPAYDLLSTQPYVGWRDPMALDFYGRANRIDRAHLVTAAGRLGVPGAAVRRMLDAMCQAAESWLERVDEIGLDAKPTTLLRDLLRSRLIELGSA